ncbi:MAG: hypothetical protein WCV93_03715 [Candidatus Shapirobacteria bacterium]|jgi:hypothetical protein
MRAEILIADKPLFVEEGDRLGLKEITDGLSELGVILVRGSEAPVDLSVEVSGSESDDGVFVDANSGKGGFDYYSGDGSHTRVYGEVEISLVARGQHVDFVGFSVGNKSNGETEPAVMVISRRG